MCLIAGAGLLYDGGAAATRDFGVRKRELQGLRRRGGSCAAAAGCHCRLLLLIDCRLVDEGKARNHGLQCVSAGVEYNVVRY